MSSVSSVIRFLVMPRPSSERPWATRTFVSRCGYCVRKDLLRTSMFSKLMKPTKYGSRRFTVRTELKFRRKQMPKDIKTDMRTVRKAAAGNSSRLRTISIFPENK